MLTINCRTYKDDEFNKGEEHDSLSYGFKKILTRACIMRLNHDFVS